MNSDPETRKKNNYYWLIRGITISPLCIILTIILGGGGHGTSLPAIVLYPGIYILNFRDDFMIWTWLLLQFPAYGLLLDFARTQSRGHIYVIALIAIHITMILLAASQT